MHLTFVAKSDISLDSDSMECGGSGFLGRMKNESLIRVSIIFSSMF